MAVPSTLQSASLSAIAADAPVYQGYLPLSTTRKEIRVLDIGPGLGCSLYHVDLDKKPAYFALSYYWGAQGEELPITVNGEQVKLRKTLHRFFEILQKRFTNLTVWVDVICINQRDRVEQSHQVSMMGDIYRQAASVYAWLGDGDADSDFALSYIEQSFPSQRNIKVEKPVGRYLEQLFQRPYFTRSWIVQECALNASVSVICGKHILEWDSLQLAFNRIAQSNKMRPVVAPSHSEYFPHSPGSTGLMRVQQARDDISSGKPASIFKQVNDFSYTECADPSDKIYAFRALATDSHKIRVDYTQSTLSCIFQVLSISYQDREEARSSLLEQAIKLLRCTNLTESQMLLGLSPSPADVLIESFAPDSSLGGGHYYAHKTMEETDTLPEEVQRSFDDLFSAPRNAFRFVVPGGSSDSRFPARAYLAIDIDLEEERIVGARCLQDDLLTNIMDLSIDIVPSRQPERDNFIASCLSGLERMKPVKDIFEGRLKLCRKARQFEVSEYDHPFGPEKEDDTGEGYKQGVHMSRVALIAFLACSLPGRTCPESLINYSRDHPPTSDEAECNCTEDLLFSHVPDLESRAGSLVSSDDEL